MNKCSNIGCEGFVSEDFYQFSMIHKPGCFYEEEIDIYICGRCFHKENSRIMKEYFKSESARCIDI